jgi:hypothetical protein
VVSLFLCILREREREKEFSWGIIFVCVGENNNREREKCDSPKCFLLLYLLHRTIILLSEEGLIMRGVNNREENW